MFLLKNLHIVSMSLMLLVFLFIIIKQARIIDDFLKNKLPLMGGDFDGDNIQPIKTKNRIIQCIGFDHPRLYKHKIKKSPIIWRIWAKEFKKVLFTKEFSTRSDYGYNQFHDVKGYIEYYVTWSLRKGLIFNVNIPNRSYASHTRLKGIFEVLEAAIIGQAKYERLKEDLRRQDMWNKLDPDFGYDVVKMPDGNLCRHPKPKQPKRKQDRCTFIIGHNKHMTMLQINRSNAIVEVICTPKESSEILDSTKEVFHFPELAADDYRTPVLIGDNKGNMSYAMKDREDEKAN